MQFNYKLLKVDAYIITTYNKNIEWLDRFRSYPSVIQKLDTLNNSNKHKWGAKK